MEFYLTVIVFTGAVLLAMLLFIAAKPRQAIRVSGVVSVVAAVGGLVIYGYGFGATLDNLLLACARTLISVCGMFVAALDFSSISDAPLFSYVWAEILYWVLHLMAFYATVSAALATFGAGFLRRLRLALARWEDVHLIYGISDRSLDFGRELMDADKGSLVFVDDGADDARISAVGEMGAVLRADPQAVNAAPAFLRSIGISRGKRRLYVYALSGDREENRQYARALLTALEARHVAPQQTSLVIHGLEDSAAAELQVLGNRYGYGFLTIFQEAGLAARLLVQKYPPCNEISFDNTGRAEQDFETVVVGFGRIGQAVLKQLIMNGQFTGSHFRAAVVAPDFAAVNGAFSSISGQLLKNYDISFCTFDARSAQMYDYLRSRGSAIRSLVLCAGSDKANQEIAEELTAFFERNALHIPVYQCSYQGVRAYDAQTKAWVQHKLYHPGILNARSLDEMAMVINHYYQGGNGVSALEDWLRCDSFSRMSCRASADFLEAMLRMAGKTGEEVLTQGWHLTQEQLTNLSVTEHMRWCAFHFCMGFAPMSEAEYDARAEQYLVQKAAGQKPIRIGKNMEKRTHACLIPWEALDALSQKESAITGKRIDYKTMDTDNVLAVPRLLEIRKTL